MSTDSTPDVSGGEAGTSGVEPSPPPSTILTADDLDTAVLLVLIRPGGDAHAYSAAGLSLPDIAAMLRATAHSLDDNST